MDSLLGGSKTVATICLLTIKIYRIIYSTFTVSLEDAKRHVEEMSCGLHSAGIVYGLDCCSKY